MHIRSGLRDKRQIQSGTPVNEVHVLDHYRKLYKYLQSLVGNEVRKCSAVHGPLIE